MSVSCVVFVCLLWKILLMVADMWKFVTAWGGRMCNGSGLEKVLERVGCTLALWLPYLHWELAAHVPAPEPSLRAARHPSTACGFQVDVL